MEARSAARVAGRGLQGRVRAAGEMTWMGRKVESDWVRRREALRREAPPPRSQTESRTPGAENSEASLPFHVSRREGARPAKSSPGRQVLGHVRSLLPTTCRCGRIVFGRSSS